MRAPRRMRATLGLGLAVTVCACLVASCQEDTPQPSALTDRPTKTVKQSATPSPARTDSPTATATPVPVQERVVRHFVTAVNRAYDTGDVRGLRELSTPGCRSCTNLIRLARDIHTKGGRVEGDPDWHLRGAHLVPDDGIVQAYVKLAAHTVVPAKGAEPQHRKAAVVFYEFTVKRQEDGWQVSKLVDAT